MCIFAVYKHNFFFVLIIFFLNYYVTHAKGDYYMHSFFYIIISHVDTDSFSLSIIMHFITNNIPH